jgi:hypothetical protein
LKKYAFLLFPVVCYANNASWQSFENNMYIGGGYSNNMASINQFGTLSNSSPYIDLGLTALLSNNIYFNVEFDGNFLNKGSYVSNWFYGSIRLGCGIQAGMFNFIPYIIGGYGNQGAYYSSANNWVYGLGITPELMINKNWLLYVDGNYQWQSFSGSINNDFNTNVLNNYANYQLSGNPGIINVALGAKYVTSNGFYVNPYFRYENYSQSFNQVSGSINYGTLNPNTNQYQVGVNIGLSM